MDGNIIQKLDKYLNKKINLECKPTTNNKEKYNNHTSYFECKLIVLDYNLKNK